MSRLLRAFACAAGCLMLFAASPARAQVESYEVRQQASFEIWSGNTRLGIEKFRIYATHDTLISASTVRFDGAPANSGLPFEKRTTFLQRAYDSYPLLFQIVEQPRDDTLRTMSLNCVFRDTMATIYKEVEQRGVGTSVALPPGRLYLLEPGIYLTVQLLVADFAAGTQETRRQPVLIPSLEQIVELHLTRGPVEAIVVRGRRVDARHVGITDKLTELIAWVDEKGRLWKLEAPGQGLRVERGPDLKSKSADEDRPTVPARVKKRPASTRETRR